MENMFEELAQELPNKQPETLIEKLAAKNITNYQDYLLFQGEAGETTFYQNLNFLLSPVTLQPRELQQLQHFRIFAQTIDGDYLGADEQHTYIIPVSLNKADVETYNLPAIDFLKALISRQIDSAILPSGL